MNLAMHLGMKGGAPQKLRQRVFPTRLTGRITDWKGKFGWITPDTMINHPEAKLHKGQVYLSQMDVEAEISGVGAHVSFFVYADGTGLGAMNCRPAFAVPTITQPIRKPILVAQEGKGFAGPGKGGPGIKQRIGQTKVMGTIKDWKGGFGWITPDQPVAHPLYRGQIYVKSSDVVGGQTMEAGVKVEFYVYIDAQGVGAEEVVPCNGGTPAPNPAVILLGAKPAVENKDPGPRERLTIVHTTGELLDWKGSFGWIKPHEPVDHPQAVKRNGNLYVAKKDMTGESGGLHVGQLLQFHVFVDNSGLGAEECMPF